MENIIRIATTAHIFVVTSFFKQTYAFSLWKRQQRYTVETHKPNQVTC